MGQVIYFLSLNLTRIAELRKEDLVKYIRKRTIQTGRLFLSLSYFLIKNQYISSQEFDCVWGVAFPEKDGCHQRRDSRLR